MINKLSCVALTVALVTGITEASLADMHEVCPGCRVIPEEVMAGAEEQFEEITRSREQMIWEQFIGAMTEAEDVWALLHGTDQEGDSGISVEEWLALRKQGFAEAANAAGHMSIDDYVVWERAVR